MGSDGELELQSASISDKNNFKSIQGDRIGEIEIQASKSNSPKDEQEEDEYESEYESEEGSHQEEER